MRLVLHERFDSDLDAILEYYESVGGQDLADDFYAELRRSLLQAAGRPESFSIRKGDVRRVNLVRFPAIFSSELPAMLCAF